MKQLHLSIIVMTCIFATSCNRYYYKPNAVNAPLFTDKGQLHCNFAGSTGDGSGAGNTNFFDLQGAYSPIKHLGIIANYSTYSYTPGAPDMVSGNVAAKAYLAEAGIGGYYPVGEKKFKLVLDIYGGGGLGKLESDVDMKVTRLFMQPGIGVTSDFFDAGFNMRLTNLRFSDFDANGRDNMYLASHNLIDPNGNRIDNGSFTFLEPAITIRAGYKFAKVQFQSVFANPISNVYWNHNGARFTVGFYFSVEGLVDIIREGKTPAN